MLTRDNHIVSFFQTRDKLPEDSLPEMSITPDPPKKLYTPM